MGFLVKRGCKSHKDTCSFEHIRDVHAFVAHNLETTGFELAIAREVNQGLESNTVRLGRERLKILVLFVTSYLPIGYTGFLAASVVKQSPVTYRGKREMEIATSE